MKRKYCFDICKKAQFRVGLNFKNENDDINNKRIIHKRHREPKKKLKVKFLPFIIGLVITNYLFKKILNITTYKKLNKKKKYRITRQRKSGGEKRGRRSK